jgi:hypothetical protein
MMPHLKIIGIFILLSALQACTSVYQPYDAPERDFPEVSAIELRSIQTRKFNKPLSEVAQGIITNCKDKNGNGRLYTSCVWPFEGYYYSTSLRKLDRLSYRVEYELSQDKQSPTNQTIVRMRIYFIKSSSGYRGNNEPQVTNVKYYQREFKDIADTLFVSAIELAPIEMQ